MTWKELKLATLQKCFASNGMSLDPEDDVVSEYLYAMPQAANEALAILLGTGCLLQMSCTVYGGVNDLPAMAPDYHAGGSIAYDGGMKPVRGRLIENRFLILPDGEYCYFYDAWPEELRQDTPDNYELPLRSDAAAAMPLYMASQIYKDDNLAIATTYRSEFDAAVARMKPEQKGIAESTFASVTGWC